VNDISNYMKEAFGLSVPLQKLDAEELRTLPVYLRGAYEFWVGRLLNSRLIFAEVKDREELSPLRLKKQSRELFNLRHCPVIFVFKELESWNRSRLIEQHVSFMELGKQLYVPELLLHLNDISGRNSIQLHAGEKLGMYAQAILLWKLIKSRMDPLEYQYVSDVMDCSLMTVSRSMRELAAAGLVTIEEGKPNLVHFNTHGKDLWEQALPLLSSPVKTVWRSEKPFVDVAVDMKVSGETALAHYTMLSKGSGDTFAVGKKMFDFAKRAPGLQEQLQQHYGDYMIQIWDYDPDLVAQNFGGVVDRLSLYLSMKDHIEDERMEAALEELLNKMEW
jgi:hypothetical protein